MDALEVLSDSVRQARDWRNIQQIVITSFARVVEALEAQRTRISTLETALATLEARQHDALMAFLRAPEAAKALRQSLDTDLSTRCASIAADVAQSVRQAMDALLAAHLQSLQRRDVEERALLKSQWETWCDDHVSEEKANEVKMEALVEERVFGIQQQLERGAQQLSEWQQEISLRMLSREDVISVVDSRVRNALHDQETREEQRRNTETDAVTNALQDLEHSFRGLLQRQRESIDAAVASKAEQHTVDGLRHQIDELVAVVERMHCEFKTTAGSRNDALLSKLLSDMRALRSDMNSAPRRQDIDVICDQVRELRSTLRSELFQARFIWRDARRCATTRAVQWDVQALNTHADVFVWTGRERHAERVVTTIPGLYQLHVAFFSASAPCVQVLVNGEPALSVEDVAFSFADSESVVTRVRRFRHSAGELVGHGTSAFFALPARAVITVTCDVEDTSGVQGFLHLRKM
ncbi:hypothetical protein PINS_up001083 [Pythium insidiosum]|nr:hypothetical protein PINS_up001083 [Pythium insidiosum]